MHDKSMNNNWTMSFVHWFQCRLFILQKASQLTMFFLLPNTHNSNTFTSNAQQAKLTSSLLVTIKLSFLLLVIKLWMDFTMKATSLNNVDSLYWEWRVYCSLTITDQLRVRDKQVYFVEFIGCFMTIAGFLSRTNR